MRSISYRTKLRLKKTLKIVLICLAVLVAAVVIATIYLQRYLVYTGEGVRLDFSRSTAADLPPVTTAAAVAPPESVQIIYDEVGQKTDEASTLIGYYIDVAMLQDPQRVLSEVQALTESCTVMIDLKSSSGNFYYNTGIAGAQLADVDITVVEQILSYLKNSGFTMVARIQTFRDSAFALANRESGLAIRGGALWSDEGYYWVNPESDPVISYLKQIIRELSSKGFQEIVLDDFYFPDSSSIVYTSEKTRSQMMQDTAKTLLNFFASSNVTVSFGSPATDFVIDNNLSHVFLSDADGSNVTGLVASYNGLSEPAKQLVFLTGSRDTRFDEYSLLRPLIP